MVRKIVIVAGTNKICQDEKAAFDRIKMIASPINNKRLNIANPCATGEGLLRLQKEGRICQVYSVLKRRPSCSDITVILVGEDLGY